MTPVPHENVTLSVCLWDISILTSSLLCRLTTQGGQLSSGYRHTQNVRMWARQTRWQDPFQRYNCETRYTKLNCSGSTIGFPAMSIRESGHVIVERQLLDEHGMVRGCSTVTWSSFWSSYVWADLIRSRRLSRSTSFPGNAQWILFSSITPAALFLKCQQYWSETRNK